MAVTTTAVFRAVAEFASLNRDLRKTRRELEQLQRQAGNTRSWDSLDEAITKATESRTKLLEATRKQSTSDRAAIKAADDHTAAIGRENKAVTAKASSLEKLATALGNNVQHTREQATASGASASASSRSSSALNQQAAASGQAASSAQAHASASNAAASATNSSTSATNQNTSAQRQNSSASQQSQRSASGLGAAYRDFSSGARQATSSGGALRGVLLGLGVPVAVGGLTTLGAALVALVGGLVAVIGAAGPAAGALGALGPAALTAAGAVGTVMLAFKGVGKALKAATKLETDSGASAEAASKRRVAAAEAIKNAQDSLTAAQRSGSRSIEAADEGVTAANKRLAASSQDILRAEQDLHDARSQAIKDLEELRELVDDNALSVEGADIGLARAKERQTEVDKDAKSSALDRREAAYAVAVAEDRRADAIKKAADDQSKLVNSERAGIENAPVVLAAKQRLTEAESAHSEALLAAQRAERDLGRAREDAAIAVARAQEQLTRAVAASKAITDEGSASARNYQQALNQLSPAGRAFVGYLLSLRPLLKEMSDAAQESFLPGLQKGIATLVPMVHSVAIPSIRAFGKELGILAQDGARTFKSWDADLRNFGTGAGPRILGNAGRALLGVADAVRHVGVAATPLLEWLSQLSMKFGDYISKSAAAARESGRLDQFFVKVKYTLALLGNILKNVGSILYSILKAAAPLGRRLLESFEAATKKTADYLKTAEGFGKLRKYFDDLEPNLRLTLKLLGKLALAFLKLGTSDSANKILRAIDKDLGPALERLARALDKVSGTLGPRIVEMISNLADAIANLLDAGAGGFFTAFVGILAAFAAVLKVLTSIPGVSEFAAALLAVAGAMKALKLVGKVTGLGALAGGLNRAVGGRQAAAAKETPLRAEPARTFLGGVSRGFSGEATSGSRGPWGTGAPTATARAGAVVGRGVSRVTGRGGAAPRPVDPGSGPGTVTRAGRAVGGAVLRGGAAVGGTAASIAGSIGGSMAGAAIGQKVGGDTGAVVGSLAGSVAGAAAPEVLAAGLSKLGPLIEGVKGKFASMASTLTGAVSGAARSAMSAMGGIAGGAGKAVGAIGTVVSAWGRAAGAAIASGTRQAAAWVLARGTAAAGLIGDLVKVGLEYGKMALAAAASATKQVLVQGAMLLVRGATVAWAAAQWILNAALSANPIGIVIVVLTALVAAFIYAWTHSEKFREIVIGVLSAVGAFFSGVWTGLLKPVFDFFVAAINWVIDHWKLFAAAFLIILGPIGIIIAAFLLFHDQIMNVIRIVADRFMWLWHAVVDPLVNGVAALFKWLWENGIKLAFDWIMGGLRNLGDFFTTVVNGIKGAWDRLYDILKKPINFFIDVVWNNGLLRAWNKVAEWIPGLPRAQPLALLAEGGPVPGTGDKDTTPALLTPDEFVVKKDIAKPTRRFLEALNAGQPEAVQAAGGKWARGPRKFAAGGAVERAMGVARSMHGKPYIWGGASPQGADCSGFMSIITNALRSAANPYHRIGATGNMPWSGFRPGMNSAFSLGFVKGNPGHTRGTLAGVNAESGGAHGNVAFGPPAKGVPMGSNYSLPEVGGQFISGGAGGGSVNPIPGMIRTIVKEITDPILSRLPAPPPQYSGIPKNTGTMFRDKSLDYFLGQAKAGGGLVKGHFGTDSVLTPTTPGEYVVRRAAVSKVGLAVLEAINRGGSISGAVQSLAAPDMHAASLFSPVSDALERMVPELAKLREILPRLAIQLSDNTGTNSRELTFNFEVNNPIAERASDTAARKMRTLASMGAFGR